MSLSSTFRSVDSTVSTGPPHTFGVSDRIPSHLLKISNGVTVHISPSSLSPLGPGHYHANEDPIPKG